MLCTSLLKLLAYVFYFLSCPFNFNAHQCGSVHFQCLQQFLLANSYINWFSVYIMSIWYCSETVIYICKLWNWIIIPILWLSYARLSIQQLYEMLSSMKVLVMLVYICNIWLLIILNLQEGMLALACFPGTGGAFDSVIFMKPSRLRMRLDCADHAKVATPMEIILTGP